jgi:hypothetical protein
LLSSPTAPSSSIVHNLAFPPSLTTSPQSILERLSPGHVFASQQQMHQQQVQQQQQQQQPGRRRPKNSLSGTVKQGKHQRNLSQADVWSLKDTMPGAAIVLKAQLEVPKRMQQKEVRLFNAFVARSIKRIVRYF